MNKIERSDSIRRVQAVDVMLPAAPRPSAASPNVVLAIALANKLARIAWVVLHKGRAFECVKTNETSYRPA